MNTPRKKSVGSTVSANSWNTSPPSDTWLTNPSAISVLETLNMYIDDRAALSPTVWERAPWSVKCSVVRAVSRACLSSRSCAALDVTQTPLRAHGPTAGTSAAVVR